MIPSRVSYRRVRCARALMWMSCTCLLLVQVRSTLTLCGQRLWGSQRPCYVWAGRKSSPGFLLRDLAIPHLVWSRHQPGFSLLAKLERAWCKPAELILLLQALTNREQLSSDTVHGWAWKTVPLMHLVPLGRLLRCGGPGCLLPHACWVTWHPGPPRTNGRLVAARLYRPRLADCFSGRVYP